MTANAASVPERKALIIDSGTFLSLIDRIGTRQRTGSNTFIYVGGSLFHTGHQKNRKETFTGGSVDVDSHRTNQRRHKDTLMLKDKMSGNEKRKRSRFGLQAARPPGNSAAPGPQDDFLNVEQKERNEGPQILNTYVGLRLASRH